MLLLFVGVGLLLMLLVLLLADRMARCLLYPPRQPVTGTPSDYGLAYEAVTFPSADGLALRGWWIPAEAPAGQPAQVAVLLHPLFGNRLGRAAQPAACLPLRQPAVDLLNLAARLHRAQHAVLLFDFRGHGESESGLCGGGLTEDQDVAGAVDYAFNRASGDSPRIALLGFGLGAAAALAAVGRFKGGTETLWIFSGDNEGGTDWTRVPPANLKRLSFVAAVQPVSLGSLFRGYLRQRFGPLGGALAGLVNRFCLSRGGYPLDSAALVKFAGGVNVPVLFVEARAAPAAERAEVEALYDAAPGPKQILWLDAPLDGVGAEADLTALWEGALVFNGASPSVGKPAENSRGGSPDT